MRAPEVQYIDLAIMWQWDRRKCVDVRAIRGVECHTDHQLLRVRVKTNKSKFYRKYQ